MAEQAIEKLAEKMGLAALCLLLLSAAVSLLGSSLYSALRIADLMSEHFNGPLSAS